LRAFELAEPRPALIVTDYAMHSMTGLGTGERLPADTAKQKVLLVSGTVGV